MTKKKRHYGGSPPVRLTQQAVNDIVSQSPNDMYTFYLYENDPNIRPQDRYAETRGLGVDFMIAGNVNFNAFHFILLGVKRNNTLIINHGMPTNLNIFGYI
jgi:hypothetical protein